MLTRFNVILREINGEFVFVVVTTVMALMISLSLEQNERATVCERDTLQY